jgi:hypothetical protein
MGFVEWYEKTYGATPNTEPGAWSWDVEAIEDYARSVQERFHAALVEKAQLVREGREQWTKWEVASMLDKLDA